MKYKYNIDEYINRGSYFENKGFDFDRIHFKKFVNIFIKDKKMKYKFGIPYIFNMFRVPIFDKNENLSGGRTKCETIKITPILLYRYIKYRINSYFRMRKLKQKWKYEFK